jgi:hypothetical protein
MQGDPFLILVQATLTSVWWALLGAVGSPDVVDVLRLLGWSGGAAAVVIVVGAVLLRPAGQPDASARWRAKASASVRPRSPRARLRPFGWVVVPLGMVYAGAYALSLYWLALLGARAAASRARWQARLRVAAGAALALVLYALTYAGARLRSATQELHRRRDSGGFRPVVARRATGGG